MSPMRDVWTNCSVDPADPEIMRIDLMQDTLTPLPDEAHSIRLLISRLEACHYKFRHHILRIITAIADGHITESGPPTSLFSAREEMCIAICGTLDSWCAGQAASCQHIAGLEPEKISQLLGSPTLLKTWQVQRICDKLRAFASPALQYVEIAESRPLYESRYRAHQQLRAETVRILINDAVDGTPARVPLDAAIDRLDPSHWAFEGNLHILLAAIGGDLNPERPLAWDGRNLLLRPDRQELLKVAKSLLSWSGFNTSPLTEGTLSPQFRDAISALGESDPVNNWLAASLAKTIAMQLS